MTIILTVVVGIVGVVAGWAVTHVYAKAASKDMAKAYGALLRQSREQTDEVIAILREVKSHVAKRDPDYARQVEKRLAGVEDEPSHKAPIWTDGDECPKCKHGKLTWSEWAPGPSGAFTAWFKCRKCGERFPGFETAGD